MKNLVLIRHAKSSWELGNVDDYDRALNKTGMKDAINTAVIIKNNIPAPDRIITSGARRAVDTVNIITNTLNIPAEFIEINDDLYLASCEAIDSLISNISDDIQTLYLCGHNPAFSEYASRYIELDQIPAGGVVYISLEINTWKDIYKNKGKVVIFDYPQNYRKDNERR